MRIENFSTTTIDGVELKGILLIPEKPKGVIQFNCGTATKKEFYLSFLSFLAENGYLCCLWDYRSNGDSKSGDLKYSDHTYSDYGTKDMPAIKNYLNKQYPNLPYFLIGHSTGGQQIGFMDNLKNVKGIVDIAVSFGYYPYMPFGYRMKAYFFFYMFNPISISLKGYVNAKRFNFMEDMPKKVANEWRDWLENPDGFFNPKYYGKTVPIGDFQNFDCPICVFYSSDDTISTESNIQSYWSQIKSSKSIELIKLSPSDYSVKKIDHFGYFKKNMRETFWKEILFKIDKMSEI